MKFVKFAKDGRYDFHEWNDEYLSMLAEIFDDGSFWTRAVEEELLNPNSKGATGNKTDVTIIGETVFIQPAYIEKADDYRIEIDRSTLLDLIKQWQVLVSKQVPLIYIVQKDDGAIQLLDYLPEE